MYTLFEIKKAGAIFFLVVIIFLCYIFVNPILFNGQISHESPQGYMAGDAYWILSNVDHTAEKGTYREIAPVFTDFSKEKFPPVDPPLFIYFAASVTNMLNIASYDGTTVAIFLLILCTILIAFVFLYELNPMVSFISLSYCLLIAFFPYSASFTWGFWRQFMGIIALFFGCIFIANKPNLRNSVFIVIALTAATLSYGIYGIFLSMVLISLYCMRLFIHRTTKTFFMNLSLIFFLTFLLTAPYLLDFIIAFNQADSVTISPVSGFLGKYDPYGAKITFSHISGLWFLAISLIILLLYLIVTLKKETLLRDKTFVILMLFLISALASFGLVERTYILRFLWPALISCIFALSIFLLFRMLFANKPIVTIFLSLLLFMVFTISIWTFLNPQRGVTYMSISPKEEWTAFEYLNERSDADANVLLVDQYLYQDAVVTGLKRHTRFLGPSDIAKLVPDNLTLTYVDSHKFCQFPNTVFKNFKFNKVDIPIKCKSQNVPLCNFDYILIALSKDYANWLENQNLNNFSLEKNFNGILLLRNNQKRCSL